MKSHMKAGTIALAALAVASILPLAAQSVSAQSVVPGFVVLPMHGAGKTEPRTSLKTWTASLTFSGVKESFTMVGMNPKKTDTTTTIAVTIVPIKMVYGKANGNTTFDPLVDQWNGGSVMQSLLNSPLFANVDWTFGSTDVGTTQYIDAYQRGSFWRDIGGRNTAYHIVFAPKVLSETTIKVAQDQGAVETNPISGSGLIGTFPLNTLDSDVQSYIAQFSQVNPSKLALFVTDNIYLTSGGCCIGGYRSVEGNGQTYAYATFVSDSPLTFASDIGAFSHELGDWLGDPGVPNFNSGFCGGNLDVADPLGGKANWGTFPVSINGVTYNPQNLVFISYFGAPAKLSANKWLDTGHLESKVCQDGP